MLIKELATINRICSWDYNLLIVSCSFEQLAINKLPNLPYYPPDYGKIRKPAKGAGLIQNMFMGL